MSNNQLTNSLINQLTHNNEHLVSKIGKLINKFTSSPINLLHRARKYNKNMQNEPNFKIAQMCVSACNINVYGNLLDFCRRKNEPKQTQNEPNFSPKLASFFPKLSSFDNQISAFANIFNLFTNSLVLSNVEGLINQLTNINLFVSNSAIGQAVLFPTDLFWRFGQRIPIVCMCYKSCAGTEYPRKRNLQRVKFHSGSFCPVTGRRQVIGRNNPLFGALRDRLLPVYRVSVRWFFAKLAARNTLRLFGDVWFQEYPRPRGVFWWFHHFRRVYLYRLCHHRQHLQRGSFFCGICRNRKGFVYLQFSAVDLKELFYYPARRRMQVRAGTMLIWPLFYGGSLRRRVCRPLTSRIVLVFSGFYFSVNYRFLYFFLFAADLSSSNARQTAWSALCP